MELLCGRVNGEHTGGLANAQGLLAGELPVNITCQSGHEVNLPHMLFALQHGLIQMGNAPSLGNVVLE